MKKYLLIILISFAAGLSTSWFFRKQISQSVNNGFLINEAITNNKTLPPVTKSSDRSITKVNAPNIDQQLQHSKDSKKYDAVTSLLERGGKSIPGLEISDNFVPGKEIANFFGLSQADQDILVFECNNFRDSTKRWENANKKLIESNDNKRSYEIPPNPDALHYRKDFEQSIVGLVGRDGLAILSPSIDNIFRLSLGKRVVSFSISEDANKNLEYTYKSTRYDANGDERGTETASNFVYLNDDNQQEIKIPNRYDHLFQIK